MAETPQANASEHIDEAELARRFEEKKRILEAAGVHSERKEIFREAFREHVAEKIEAPAPVPLLSTPAPLPSINPLAPSLPPDDTSTELQSLIAVALQEGVLKAVKRAQADTPYLIDALHDELADHYYDKLIQSGQLKPE